MDIDNLDQALLNQFNCMCTDDKEELVKQLIELSANKATTMTASFFLEMNNWNLQAAICSFFDYNQTRQLPSMVLQHPKWCSPTMGPNTRFAITWILRNVGNDFWPKGCALHHLGGNYKVQKTSIPIKKVAPGDSLVIVIEDITPSIVGSYNSQWRLAMACGTYFGEVISLLFYVDADVREVDMDDSELSDQLNSRMILNDSTEIMINSTQQNNCSDDTCLNSNVRDNTSGGQENMAENEQTWF